MRKGRCALGRTPRFVEKFGTRGHDFPYACLRTAQAFTGGEAGVGIRMSFTESSESEVSQVNKHFPNRSAAEIRQAIARAKESFLGSRGGNRLEIVAQILSQS